MGIINPLANFIGKFESADIDSRAILESLERDAITNYLNDVPVDVVEEFTLSSQWEISERPSEIGFPVSDSRRRLPDTIALVCVQATGQDPNVPIPSDGSAMTAGISWRDKYDRLREFLRTEELVTLTTPVEVFPNLLITDVQITRTKDQTDALFFSVTLREATFAEIQIANIDPRLVPRKPKPKPAKNKAGDEQAAGDTNTGEKTPEPVDRSILKSMVVGAAEIFS